MQQSRRIAPELSPVVEPIPLQRQADEETYRAPQSTVDPQTDWLAAGWKFGIGFMAAATLFGILDGLTLYILSTQGLHLTFMNLH